MTTIYQYFTDKLGAAPADDTLRQLPINSNTSGHPSGSADVRCWHLGDIPTGFEDVRSSGQTGSGRTAARMTRLTLGGHPPRYPKI
jgi:hypothetical protein